MKTSRDETGPKAASSTCLSHDIIVHEMTHALLDGLRTRFRLPTHPDVAAFHEGFADLVAMLMHFSYSDVVRAAIERSGAMLETDALLLSLASQFGRIPPVPKDHCDRRSIPRGSDATQGSAVSDGMTRLETSRTSAARFW